ncbi:hypothetical protein CHL67_05470 [Prosthecochloris sp. GSB1]|uniref:DUF3109 family protein n=1 Tax=Prosthecochloris sp. GSB1 TaxID=281093 RepID=UPI000B8CBB26|nr:DUF3109 family protein [Prosthecochloris sp. GSB1]ASQ90444.1 hypothetical protein CHL67_05470 [Prosthecochloris sp. GSB1]
MLAIDDVLIDETLPDALFSCDIDLCGGACCVEGELGAPVLREEEEGLRDIARRLRRWLPEKNIRHISRYGCLEMYQGDLYTRTIGGRECVFAFRDGPTTLCAIETAVSAGLKGMRKPLSCRLFPVRVRKKFGLDYLVYEQHSMCRHARACGKETGTALVDYVRDALVERYGMPWFNRLKEFRANLS